MSKLQFNNTYKSGRVSFLVFKEGKDYVGVCLEFDLIVREDMKEEAQEAIVDYTRAWLENVKENKLSEELLNRPAPKKYWKIQDRIVNQITNTERGREPKATPTVISQPYHNFVF